MEPIRTAKHLDQLRKRREQVTLTLKHVDKERSQAEQNTDWLDRAAYESRIALLDRLNGWYAHELDEIDKALDRVDDKTYGLCLACHNPISEHRLDLFPAAAFCASCQETREGLEAA